MDESFEDWFALDEEIDETQGVLSILPILSAYLPRGALTELTLSSNLLKDEMKKTVENKSTWIRRTAEVLGIDHKDIPERILRKDNWRVIYDIVSKSSPRKLLFNQDPDIVELALLTGIDPSLDNNRIIGKAVQDGYTEVVRLLLKDPRVDPSAQDNYAIQAASDSGYTEIVELLLKDPRVDPSSGNNYAVLFASELGYTEIVRLLLQDPRVDPSVDNNSAIGLASLNGHVEVVKLLLQDRRVDPSADNNYAVIIACKQGHEVVVKVLLEDDRVDASDRDNMALNTAFRDKRIDIIKILLKDPKVSNSVTKEMLTLGLNFLPKETLINLLTT